MRTYSNEFVLLGLRDYPFVIDQIIRELQADAYVFDIKMILTEAIANAYNHGNHRNDAQPIYVRYALENKVVRLEIQDCGGEIGNIEKLMEFDESNILNESNRGLFLIGCYSDHVEYNNHTLSVTKRI